MELLDFWPGRARDNHDRDLPCVSLSGQLLTNRMTVESWQRQIEDDEIWRLYVDRVQRIVTVAHLTHGESGEGERYPIELPERQIVFND
jgi:hypothetical protein